MPTAWEDALDGEWGFAIVPGSAHTVCYQERTGALATTPADGDGDPVGTIHDLISGLYLTIPSDDQRPLYRVDGAVTWLQLRPGGAPDWSFVRAELATYGGDDLYSLIAVRPTSDGNGRLISVTQNSFEDYDRPTTAVALGLRWDGRVNAERDVVGDGYTLTATGDDPLTDVDSIVEALLTPVSAEIRIGGGTPYTLSHDNLGPFGINRIGIMTQANSAGSNTAGRLYAALVVGAAPDGAARAALRAAAQARIDGAGDIEVPGQTLSAAASLIAGAATGERSATAPGGVLAATASLVSGAATGARSPTVPGQTLPAAASLIAGMATGERSATTPGGVLAAIASLVSGAATGAKAPTIAGQVLSASAGLIAGVASGVGPSAPATRREQALQALFAALAAARPLGTVLLRNATLPERIPTAGLMILRDGDPGEPEHLFSPPLYYYEHRAEVDVLVDAATPAARDTAFDALVRAIGAALAADRTLGGLVDYAIGEAPAPLDLPIEGAAGLKAASIGVILPYDTPDPLG